MVSTLIYMPMIHRYRALVALGLPNQLQSILPACLDDLSDWMRSNHLQLNTVKTEILWCSTTRRQNHLPSAAVCVGENHVLFVTLEFSLTAMSLCGLMSRTVSRCFAVLRHVRSIRCSVSDSVFHSLVMSLVMPRLDYCNATLAGLPAQSTLVGAQCRRQTDTSIFSVWAVTPMLWDLHWLRSPERIDFKLAVLTYRCLHGLAPRYLSDYIQSVAVSNCRRLWSLSSLQLVIWRTRLCTVGDRAFLVAGSCLWNSLPPDTSASVLTVFEITSKLISFPDYFLLNCFWLVVLHTMYSSGLAVFVL